MKIKKPLPAKFKNKTVEIMYNLLMLRIQTSKKDD